MQIIDSKYILSDEFEDTENFDFDLDCFAKLESLVISSIDNVSDESSKNVEGQTVENNSLVKVDGSKNERAMIELLTSKKLTDQRAYSGLNQSGTEAEVHLIGSSRLNQKSKNLLNDQAILNSLYSLKRRMQKKKDLSGRIIQSKK